MNDGRRQLAPPKQLLQPGAAARPAITSARHTTRVITHTPLLAGQAGPGRERRRRRRHHNRSSRFGAWRRDAWFSRRRGDQAGAAGSACAGSSAAGGRITATTAKRRRERGGMRARVRCPLRCVSPRRRHGHASFPGFSHPAAAKSQRHVARWLHRDPRTRACGICRRWRVVGRPPGGRRRVTPRRVGRGGRTSVAGRLPRRDH